MPKMIKPFDHEKRALASKLKPMNGLPIIIEAYHLRFLLIGFSKNDQAHLFHAWLTHDNRCQDFLNSLKPYKRAKISHQELQLIAINLLSQLQHLMLDMPDDDIVNQLKDIIHTTCQRNSYRSCLKAIDVYQYQVNAFLHKYDKSHQLSVPTQPWRDIEAFIYDQRLWHEHFFDFFRYKIVLLSIFCEPIVSFYRDMYHDSEQALPRLMSRLDNFIESKENTNYLFLYGLALSIEIMGYALVDRIPLIKIQSDIIQPMFLQGLLCYTQKNAHENNGAYADLMSIFPTPLSDSPTMPETTPLKPPSVKKNPSNAHEKDIKDKRNGHCYFWLTEKKHVRFNRLDLLRLHPFKKGDEAEKDIQSFYDAISRDRQLTEVTPKEMRNHQSSFFGLDAKLKPQDRFNTARLAFKLRAASINERELGIETEVYSPKVITEHNRRGY